MIEKKSDDVADVDDETENWPAPYQNRDLWEEIKYAHQVQSVMAFDIDGEIVPPKLLNGKLKGSFVF